MFAASKTDSVSGGPPDGQFNYVTMLLHGDGTNGAQNNTFVDSSTNNFTITRNGNTTQGSFSPYGSNWSNYFSDGAYLSIPNNAVFNHGSSDFTVEAMFCRTVNTGGSQTIIAKYESGWQASYSIVIVGDTWDVYMTYGIGSYTLIYSGAAPAVGVWSHMALQRSGSYWEFYCNGVRLAQVTAYTIASTTSAIRIGELGSGYSGYAFNGHISNVRIRNGYATYSGSTYTVPTANLTAITGTVLLTCQANRFIDNSSNNFTVTSGTVSSGRPSVQRFNPFGTSTAYSTSVIGGSGYFDGSGDYLDTPTSSAFAFGTGDFTSELWVYLSRSNGTIIYEPRSSGQENNPCIAYGVVTSGKFEVITGSVQITSSSSFAIAQWHHVAIVRSGTTLTLWVNGTSQGTSTLSTNLTNNDRIRVGDYFTAGSYPFQGYVSNLRVVKGTAVYTSAFTPPTAPVTAISGTSLLTNFTNAAIFDNAMMNDLETVGNAQISTSVKKYGTGSLAFDGSGDRLVSPPTYLFDLAGNFTIECWVNFNTLAGSFTGIVSYADSSGWNGWQLLKKSSNIYFELLTASGSTGSITNNVTSLNTGVWYHIAVVRSGSTISLYIDGVANGTSTTTSSFSSANSFFRVGDERTLSYPLDGYVDDLRITKGFARYTAAFTPPTAAFSDTGPY